VWIEIIHVSASVVFIDSYTAFHFSDCCSEKCPARILLSPDKKKREHEKNMDY
jgi:hypothetical protein